ncbi:hypothetical protein DFQ27_006982 [Actinomortierella ambigua]|uniref:Uncharacterized protein n=1 Tax=Actinomortierella ambigua TaxID=1343610 RepID=A0A9P6PUC3_9FUNG|nr:hypothetical protein DFQ27_006982 [Actinomortierella ambigua]
MSNEARSQQDATDTLSLRQKLEQLQLRVEKLERSSKQRGDGRVVYKRTEPGTLMLYDELVAAYPAIATPDFYNAELPKNHNVFKWSDYHYTEGFDYKPPPVLEHPELVSLSPHARRHDRDLQIVQGYFAHMTRLFDTFAHEILQAEKKGETITCERVLKFLNILRISAANDCSKITRMREKIYADAAKYAKQRK